MHKTLIDCYSFGCKYNKDLHCKKSFIQLNGEGKCLSKIDWNDIPERTTYEDTI